MCKPPKPISRLPWCFIRVPQEKWCLLGLLRSLFNFVREMIMERALSSNEYSWLTFAQTGTRLTYSMRTILCSIVKTDLSCRFFSVTWTTVWVCLECVLHLRGVKRCHRTGWAGNRILFLQGKNTEVDGWNGCISFGGCMSEVESSPVQNTWLGLTNLRRLQRRRDIRLSISDRGSVLLYRWEPWPLKTDIRRGPLFEHRFVLCIGKILWVIKVRLEASFH